LLEGYVERRQLEYFLTVAAHGSFTSAAAALRVSQPSLSHAIKAAEREVGASLFHRHGRGATLTAAGQALVGPAQQVLRDFAAAISSVQRVNDLVAGRLDLVTQTTLAVNPLAPLVGAFRRAYSGIDVRIEEPEHAAAVADMVRTGRFEFGLADFSAPTANLQSYELPAQQIVAVLPPDSELRTARRLTASQLAALDLVLPPPGTASRSMVEFALAGAGIPLRIAVETTHRAAIVPLVISGAGATLLPRPMAEAATCQGAVLVDIEPPLVRRIRLFRRPGALSRAGQAFYEMVTNSTAVSSGADPT
jgi:LysR family carnitine catabolism transcriptional activator